jgi:hypothetical protein
MKLSKNWDEFLSHLDKLHPRWDKTLPMAFEFEDKQ